MKKYCFLLILSMILIGCSFWEQDEVVGVNVIDNKIHVMHKRFKGYTLPSLSIHGGSPHTRATEIFDSSWSLAESGNHSFSATKENDWKLITSVSGEWYPVLYKAPESNFYMAYHNISEDVTYVQRYSTRSNQDKETKFDFICKPKTTNPCFAVDRYATRFFAAGSIYNASDFTLLQALESKAGYLKFVKSINQARQSHNPPLTFFPIQIKFSSDGQFLFHISGLVNSKTIFAYKIKTDSVEKIELELSDNNSNTETEVTDIDSHNGFIQAMLETRKSKQKNCGSPCSGYSRPTYAIYDVTKKKRYPIPFERFFYHITDNFWDIKNSRLYALTGKKMNDIDQLEVFNYADDSTRTLRLNHLIH